ILTHPLSFCSINVNTHHRTASGSECMCSSLSETTSCSCNEDNLSFQSINIHPVLLACLSTRDRDLLWSWFDGFDRVHIKFLYEFSEKFDCITSSVINISWQTKMIGTAWQDTASAILSYKQELYNNFFSGMYRW